MSTSSTDEQGRRLLTAIDRILDNNSGIREVVAKYDRAASGAGLSVLEERQEYAAERIVQHYSTRAAISGGATSLPGLVPFAGGILAATGGTLADMAYMMKFEIEMALALSTCYGFDIDDEHDRHVAYLLASVNMYNVSTSRSFFGDIVAAEGTAVWNYASRELSKLILKALAVLAVASTSKGLVKAIPLVGIAASAGFNKFVTGRVGAQIKEELRRRARVVVAVV